MESIPNNQQTKLRRSDILYPDLSFKIVGLLFEVSNKLGGNMLEKYYQKAIASVLKREGINFKEQVEAKLNFDNEIIAKGNADFIIEEKIILEIKRGDRFVKTNIDQVNSYLNMTNMQLGILANFTSRGLIYKRIVNIQSETKS